MLVVSVLGMCRAGQHATERRLHVRARQAEESIEQPRREQRAAQPLQQSLDEERRDASGERGTAEMKLAGASWIKGPTAFGAASVYAKTPPKRPLESAMDSMPAYAE